MTFFGKSSIADCRHLESALDLKIRSLRTAHGELRASWERTDIFGAERYARDLAGLEARWKDARGMLGRVRVGRRAAMTPAQAAYDRLVRAVRQGGATAPMQRGDLAELTRRLQKRAGTLPGFGFEWSEVWNANPAVSAYNDFQAWTGNVKNLKDCADMITVFRVAIPDLVHNFDLLAPAWRAVSPEGVEAFARDVGAMQAAWNAAVARVQPMLNEYGASDTTAAQEEWDALNAAAGQTVPLNARLAQGRRAVATSGGPAPAFVNRPLPQPKADSQDGFMKWTDPNRGGVPGMLADAGSRLVGDKNGERRGDTPWYADPLGNRWIQAGLVVGAIGVVGYTLSEVRAVLPGR